jgi:hypothetical protein
VHRNCCCALINLLVIALCYFSYFIFVLAISPKLYCSQGDTSDSRSSSLIRVVALYFDIAYFRNRSIKDSINQNFIFKGTPLRFFDMIRLDIFYKVLYRLMEIHTNNLRAKLQIILMLRFSIFSE